MEERVIFLVDIEDSVAKKRKLQISLTRELLEKDFFFLIPPEYKEYDPKSFFYGFDDSIIDSEEFRERFNPGFDNIRSLEIKKKQLQNILEKYNLVIFCKGLDAKKDLRELILEVYSKLTNFHMSVFENTLCDREYTKLEEIYNFEYFLDRVKTA